MQHQVHQREAVRILHVLHAVEGVAAIFTLLRFRPRIGVTVFTDVAIGGDEKAAGAGGRVLDDVFQRRLHHRHHAVDQRTRREVLAGAGFLLVGVLLQQAFVQIAQPLLPCAVPVEFVDLGDEGGERGGFLDEGTGVAEDLLHQRGAVAAEMDQGELVGFEPVRCSLGFEVVPTVAGGDLLLGAGLLGHLEEQEIGQLGDVLVIGDPVVLEDVTEVPEFGDDVVGDGAHVINPWPAGRGTAGQSLDVFMERANARFRAQRPALASSLGESARIDIRTALGRSAR